MKKVFLLLALLTSFLFLACKDNVQESLDEPQDKTEEEETNADNVVPEPVKVLLSVDISKVFDTQGNETIPADSLIDLVLCSIESETKSVLATWSNYSKMKDSVFTVSNMAAGTYKFELQGSYQGKAYKGTIETEILDNEENKLSFELTEIPSSQVSGESNVIMDISVKGLSEIPFSYTQEAFCVHFTTPYETANWYIDSQKFIENSGTFTFYPKTLKSETYTITITDESEGFRSSSIFVRIQMPVDFRIASTEFYTTMAKLDESDFQNMYHIHFTDSNPNLYEIARTLTAFNHFKFTLDFSDCVEMSELPSTITNPQNTEEEMSFIAERSNVYGIMFGDNDITVCNKSLYLMPNLEYLVFGDGNNTICGSAMYYGGLNPIKYLSFGDGDNYLESCSLPSSQFEFISFGNGNNTLSQAAFITNTGPSEHDCYMYFGDGSKIIGGSSLPNNALHLFIGKGYTNIKDVPVSSPSNNRIVEIHIAEGDVVMEGYGLRYTSIKKFSMGDGKLTNCDLQTSTLEEVEFGNGDKTFAFNALYNTKVQHINLKNGNVTTNLHSFGDMPNLKTFTMGDGDIITKGSNTFYSNELLEEVTFGNGKHLFSTITAFNECPALRTLTLGDGDTIFGSTCFTGDISLETVTIGKGDLQIQNGAFINCSNLETLFAEDGISFIGDTAFVNCSKLQNIRLNKKCTEIGNNVFVNCKNLTITVDEDNPAFTADDNGRRLLNKDKTIIYFWNAAGDVVIPEGVTFNDACPFRGNTKITSLKISKTIDYLPSGYISDCSALERLYLPDSENWYYTTKYEDAQNKVNGTQVETDVDGAVTSSFLNKLINSPDNTYYSLYKVEANND